MATSTLLIFVIIMIIWIINSQTPSYKEKELAQQLLDIENDEAATYAAMATPETPHDRNDRLMAALETELNTWAYEVDVWSKGRLGREGRRSTDKYAPKRAKH